MSTREERARKLAAKHIAFIRRVMKYHPQRDACLILEEARDEAARYAAMYLTTTGPGWLAQARDEARACALLDDRLSSARRRHARSGGHDVR